MDKLEFNSLVSPEEAVRLCRHRGVKDIYIANEIADEYKINGNVKDIRFLYGAIWNAGRLQGVREERAKNKSNT